MRILRPTALFVPALAIAACLSAQKSASAVAATPPTTGPQATALPATKVGPPVCRESNGPGSQLPGHLPTPPPRPDHGGTRPPPKPRPLPPNPHPGQGLPPGSLPGGDGHRPHPPPQPPTKPKSQESQLITELQNNLDRLGFEVGPIDGKLGPKTCGAVQEYGITKGLKLPIAITPALVDKLKEATK